MRYEYLKINRVAAEYCMVVENERWCIFDVDEAVEANDKPRRRRSTCNVRSVANV